VNEPPKCGAVVNVALLDDTVFVVGELSDRIRVFDVRSTPCTELDEIRVEGLKWPTDVAVCPDDGKLFVADSFYFNRCVWQVRQTCKDIHIRSTSTVV
jgi:DNA-binding beta-propeller fold protein YncE